MEEFIELRVRVDQADGMFRRDEGALLSSGHVRAITITGDDPRLPLIITEQVCVLQIMSH
jgi:hypothetical protein